MKHKKCTQTHVAGGLCPTCDMLYAMDNHVHQRVKEWEEDYLERMLDYDQPVSVKRVNLTRLEL